MTPKRILICGSRHFRDAKRIFKYLKELPPDTVIIEGEARGTDTIVWVCCEILGLKYIPFPADWSAYHNVAGLVRNKQILIEGYPDLVVFYHDNLEESWGTISMLEMADKAKIPIEEGPEYPEFWEGKNEKNGELDLFQDYDRLVRELNSFPSPYGKTTVTITTDPEKKVPGLQPPYKPKGNYDTFGRYIGKD